MGSLTAIYLDRSNNEIMIAESLKRLTEKAEDKVIFSGSSFNRMSEAIYQEHTFKARKPLPQYLSRNHIINSSTFGRIYYFCIIQAIIRD